MTLSTPQPSTERREAYFAGRVQGVGFRYTTREVAGRHPVVGYVQNLFDGRVLVVAEGEPKSLDRFLDDVRATMARYIESVTVSVRPATGEFERFEIRV